MKRKFISPFHRGIVEAINMLHGPPPHDPEGMVMVFFRNKETGKLEFPQSFPERLSRVRDEELCDMKGESGTLNFLKSQVEMGADVLAVYLHEPIAPGVTQPVQTWYWRKP